jgi:hypothetical protein
MYISIYIYTHPDTHAHVCVYVCIYIHTYITNAADVDEHSVKVLLRLYSGSIQALFRLY